jgi:hypothetical protein
MKHVVVVKRGRKKLLAYKIQDEMLEDGEMRHTAEKI